MLHWFKALLPKNDQFFDLFAAHSRAIVAGAQERGLVAETFPSGARRVGMRRAPG